MTTWEDAIEKHQSDIDYFDYGLDRVWNMVIGETADLGHKLGEEYVGRLTDDECRFHLRNMWTGDYSVRVHYPKLTLNHSEYQRRFTRAWKDTFPDLPLYNGEAARHRYMLWEHISKRADQYVSDGVQFACEDRVGMSWLDYRK